MIKKIFIFKHLKRRIYGIGCFLGICFVLTGCVLNSQIEDNETKNFKHGVISIGSIWSGDYDNKSIIWKHQNEYVQSIKKIREKLLELKKNNASEDPVKVIMEQQTTLQYLRDELEEADFDTEFPVKKGYRRIWVSFLITAWTHSPTREAMIIAEFIPRKIDQRCNDLVVDPNYKRELIQGKNNFQKIFQNNFQKIFNAYNWTDPFAGDALNKLALTTKSIHGVNKIKIKMNPHKSPTEAYASCHKWFIDKHLFPKVVKVESPQDFHDDFVHEESLQKYLEGLNIDGGVPGLHGGVNASKTRQDLMMIESYMHHLTTVGFAGGDNRVGWIFNTQEESVARPISRRLFVILDIPNSLKYMSMYVNKYFFDKNFSVNPSFSADMSSLKNVRKLLDEVDDERVRAKGKNQQDHYLFEDHWYWTVKQSRLRNIWALEASEHFHICIPPKEKSHCE